MNAGLLGYPIGHSLSPVIHNAAYQALGLDWQYELYPCADRAAFEAVLSEALANPEDYVGFNVTTPYKALAFEVASEHASTTQLIHNANVLSVVRPAEAIASASACIRSANTDGQGLVAFLERGAGVTLLGSKVVLCGTGAVALSTLATLLGRQVASITVVSRNALQAQVRIGALCGQLAATQEQGAPLPEPVVIDYQDIAPSLTNADVLIDATTVGMDTADEAVLPTHLIRPHTIVCDLVYGHGETALLKGARQQGAQAYDGLGMLVEQAALTIELWAQEQGLIVEAPRELMLATARAGF
ncbi:MAG: shikimate dehydrogenase [Coriobacteriia bacterium]|nr:shikimate dehydrogenase [Coriobacteriia bacterium]